MEDCDTAGSQCLNLYTHRGRQRDRRVREDAISFKGIVNTKYKILVIFTKT